MQFEGLVQHHQLVNNCQASFFFVLHTSVCVCISVSLYLIFFTFLFSQHSNYIGNCLELGLQNKDVAQLNAASFSNWDICKCTITIMKDIQYRSLEALRAPTSSWRPFKPLDFVLRTLGALKPCDPRHSDWIVCQPVDSVLANGQCVSRWTVCQLVDSVLGGTLGVREEEEYKDRF